MNFEQNKKSNSASCFLSFGFLAGIFLGAFVTVLLMNRPIQVMRSQLVEARKTTDRAMAYNRRMDRIIQGNKQAKEEFDRLEQANPIP